MQIEKTILANERVFSFKTNSVCAATKSKHSTTVELSILGCDQFFFHKGQRVSIVLSLRLYLLRVKTTQRLH